MNRFVLCHPLSSGSFWIYAVFLLLAVSLFLVFLVLVIRTRRIGPQKESVILRYKRITFILKGPAVYLALCVVFVVLMFFYPWIDHRSGLDVTPYPQHVDLNVKTSLKALRDKLEGFSNRVIHLDPAIEELEIEGEYDGACVADLFYAICLRHPDKLSCDWPVNEQVLYIRSKSP